MHTKKNSNGGRRNSMTTWQLTTLSLQNEVCIECALLPPLALRQINLCILTRAVLLQLHNSIGCGQLTAIHLGGMLHRWEYILAGPPMTQVPFLSSLSPSLPLSLSLSLSLPFTRSLPSHSLSHTYTFSYIYS